jgi:hypothetical protein
VNLTWLAYAADAYILGSYALSVAREDQRVFHRANAYGGIALFSATMLTTGWNPLLVLTIAFTALGWLGLYRTEAAAQ